MHNLRKILAAVLVIFTPLAASANGSEIAFYYGANPPVNELSQFSRIVLEPDNIKATEHQSLRQHGATTFAYMSIGEIGPTRPWFNTLPDSAVFGTNDSWNSKVMDLTSADWQRFVLQRVNDLTARGYNGLFLDTMDSYQLFAKTPEQKQQQEQGLGNLLYRIKRQHPNLRLIANRGFEIIDQIAPYLEGIAAESLYSGWDNSAQKYVTVPDNDREWLSTTLSRIKDKHQLDIIVIDYVPPAERGKAREVAAKITSDGFIPWVANPSLDYVGVSTLEVISRDVLLIYDSRETESQAMAEVHTLLAMPLEYMGYVPVYLDLAKDTLPAGVLKGNYAGVAIWNRQYTETPGYKEWLIKNLKDNTPFAFFGGLGTPNDAQLNELLGITPVNELDQDSLTLKSADTIADFEHDIPPRLTPLSMIVRSSQPANTPHIRFADKDGNEADTVITGPWGGLAIFPTVIEIDIDARVDWIINPFVFLRKALQLTNAPMPDVTSENGYRLWLAHIDGDALPSWAELPGKKLGAEVLYDEILTKYDLPHTVSIVEAEMVSFNQYIDRSARMFSVIRKTFELDNVELATHTFSHPFKWDLINNGDASGKMNLPVSNYRFNTEREILGSLDFINRTLAPPHKTAKIVLWSGNALPNEDAMQIIDRNGLLNMNGGATRISKAHPSVASISPNARIVNDLVQVYAPIINENVYTNDWTGPFDGYRNVLETFAMTEYPRRIKPVNVYYHNYIGTKAASLRSLKEVYEWSVAQDIFPVFASEYMVKVPDFRTAGVSRYLDGRWKISGLGSVRSLRILSKNAWPDLSSTGTVIGARALHDGIYLHTNGANTVSFYTSKNKPQQPHLVSSNAKVESWRATRGGRVSFRLRGHAPVTLELSGDKRFCDLRQQDNVISGELTPDGNTRYQFSTKDTGNAVIDCQT